MKKETITLLLGLSFVLSSFSAGWALSLKKEANLNETVTTSKELVAAVSGERVYVREMTVSLAAADTFTLKCGTTTKFGPIYLDTNSGLTKSFQDLVCADNEALNGEVGSSTTDFTVHVRFDQF